MMKHVLFFIVALIVVTHAAPKNKANKAETLKKDVAVEAKLGAEEHDNKDEEFDVPEEFVQMMNDVMDEDEMEDMEDVKIARLMKDAWPGRRRRRRW